MTGCEEGQQAEEPSLARMTMLTTRRRSWMTVPPLLSIRYSSVELTSHDSHHRAGRRE